MPMYIRFSEPGRPGYIPGTSKDKYRSDWIDVPGFSVSGNDTRRVATSVSFSHEHDKTSDRFQNFAVNDVTIEKIVVENVADDGGLIFRVVMGGAYVDSFNQSRKGHETIVLAAIKIDVDDYGPKRPHITKWNIGFGPGGLVGSTARR